MKEPDKAKAPSFLSRSLACAKLELQTTRCASSAKLRQAYETRFSTNQKAKVTLENHQKLWHLAGGPPPDEPAAAPPSKCRDNPIFPLIHSSPRLRFASLRPPFGPSPSFP